LKRSGFAHGIERGIRQRAAARLLAPICMLGLLALSACGQSGPLVLPSEAGAASQATGATEESDAKEEDDER